MTPETETAAQRVERRNRVGSIIIEGKMNADNLAIALASYFEGHLDRPTDDDDGELGWGKWVLQKTDEALDLVASEIQQSHAKEKAELERIKDALRAFHYDTENPAEVVKAIIAGNVEATAQLSESQAAREQLNREIVEALNLKNESQAALSEANSSVTQWTPLRAAILAPAECGVAGHFKFQENGMKCSMCQRDKHLRDELLSTQLANRRMREALKAAPHDPDCKFVPPILRSELQDCAGVCECTCWKAKALSAPSGEPLLDRVVEALEQLLPEWEVDPEDTDGHIACEITNRDVRAVRALLTDLKGAANE